VDQLRCHANDYYQNRDSFDDTCAPRPQFNFGANEPSQFYKVDFRAKPDAQFLMDLITYDSTGTLATMDTVETEGYSIPTGESSSTSCEVERRIVVNMKKTGDNTSLVDIKFSGRMASTAAACQALAKTAIANAAYNKVPGRTEDEKRRAIEGGDLEYTLSPSGFIFNLTRAQ
jgi:hypothetical protein